MAKMSFVLVFGLLTANASACEKIYYGIDNKMEIPETYQKFRDCEPTTLSNNAPVHNEFDYDSLNKQEAPVTSAYWSDWMLQTDANPFLSQQYANSYFGVGVWAPTELEDREEELTTQEWLMNHGLQFSVGFGDKKAGEPRLRLDYMWHDEQQDNLMMQVELPF